MVTKTSTVIQNCLQFSVLSSNQVDFSKLQDPARNTHIGCHGTYILHAEEPLTVTLGFYADGRSYNMRHTIIGITTLESQVNFYENHPETITILIKPGEKHIINAKNSSNNSAHLCWVDIERF